MRLFVLTATLGLFATCCRPSAAQTTKIEGRIITSSAKTSLPGANVQLIRLDLEATPRGTVTDSAGRFAFASVQPGSYELVASFVGYRTLRLELDVTPTGTFDLQIEMTATTIAFDEVVTTASRRPEKLLDAPAAVYSRAGDELRAGPTPNLTEHLTTMPGMHVSRIGLNAYRTVSRGFESADPYGLYTLTDYRIAQVPSLRLNFYQMIPISNEDLDRVEVVNGPGSALYGPNVTNGVVHFITKSAMDHPGSTLSVGGGERGVFLASGRHAGVVGDKFGYKITGQYFRGNDWNYHDPAEPDSIIFGTQTPTGRVNEDGLVANVRDTLTENWKLESQLEFHPTPELTATLTGGFSRIRNNELSTIGASRGQDWDYSFVQARLLYKDLFAQGYVNHTDAGDSYFYRSGDRIVDLSRMYVGQVQHRMVFENQRLELTYGSDLLYTDARTEGTIHGRNEDDDSITEIGGYVQAQFEATDQLRLVGATRLDHHSRFDDPVFSPRIAAVFSPTAEHSVRATYNRSYRTPTNIDLFVDLLILPDLGGLPFPIRSRGVPESGYHFIRNETGGTGGLYMQSPFTPPEFGGPATYLPADATLLWPAVVAILQAQNVDLSGLPAPSSNEVGTQLKSLNLSTQQFDKVTPGQINDIRASPFITNTFEVGYRGVLSRDLAVSLDIWHAKVDHLTTLAVATPNVFLAEAPLIEYLAQYLPAANAQALGQAIAGIPLATVTPKEAGDWDPANLILTPIDGDGYSVSGVDLSFVAVPAREWRVRGTYSYISKNVFEKTATRAFDFSTNAPRHRVGGSVAYTRQRADAELRYRYVDEFEVLSGVYGGTVDAYGVLDLAAGYRLPTKTSLRVSLSVQNVLDNGYQAFIGAPEIGRLGLLQLTFSTTE